MSDEQGRGQQTLSVPVEGTLAVTRRQRNNLADENAALWAHVEQLTTELAEARAELEQLRASAE